MESYDVMKLVKYGNGMASAVLRAELPTHLRLVACASNLSMPEVPHSLSQPNPISLKTIR
jgi:hypothetical protein